MKVNHKILDYLQDCANHCEMMVGSYGQLEQEDKFLSHLRLLRGRLNIIEKEFENKNISPTPRMIREDEYFITGFGDGKVPTKDDE